MNRAEASSIAQIYISKMQQDYPIDIEINHDITEEYPVGYVFFYNSTEFWHARDMSVSLVGNGPLLVLKETGELVILPSYQSVKRSIAEYEN